jgi:PPOX class probable F420-dependent enzyme
VRLSPEEARARFAEARAATLATLGGDGAPQLVPITFAVEGEHVYTAVDHKPKAPSRLQRLRNIARDPRVAVLCQHYGDEWDELWWARAEGRASIITDAVAMRHPLDVLAARYAQYDARRPDGPVIVIRVERWSGWSAAG